MGDRRGFCLRRMFDGISDMVVTILVIQRIDLLVRSGAHGCAFLAATATATAATAATTRLAAFGCFGGSIGIAVHGNHGDCCFVNRFRCLGRFGCRRHVRLRRPLCLRRTRRTLLLRLGYRRIRLVTLDCRSFVRLCWFGLALLLFPNLRLARLRLLFVVALALIRVLALLLRPAARTALLRILALRRLAFRTCALVAATFLRPTAARPILV